jgi:hypothetical protein
MTHKYSTSKQANVILNFSLTFSRELELEGEFIYFLLMARSPSLLTIAA